MTDLKTERHVKIYPIEYTMKKHLMLARENIVISLASVLIKGAIRTSDYELERIIVGGLDEILRGCIIIVKKCLYVAGNNYNI